MAQDDEHIDKGDDCRDKKEVGEEARLTVRDEDPRSALWHFSDMPICPTDVCFNKNRRVAGPHYARIYEDTPGFVLARIV